MQIITRTIYGGAIQTCMFQGIPYSPLANTTLNERLTIQPNVKLSTNEYPRMRYWAIGAGGMEITAGADSRPKITPLDFKPNWSAPFLPRPFVLRREDNDLTAERRVNYGLRRAEEHNGVRYFAYYLKRIDQSTTVANMMRNIIRNGVSTVVPLVPTNEDMNPTPTYINPAEAVPTLADGDELSVSSITEIPFTEWDVAEFVNAVTIIDGDEEQAVISEICLVAAVDRAISAPAAGGATFTFNEACVATVVQHISTYENFAFTNNETTFVIDAGVSESLLTGS